MHRPSVLLADDHADTAALLRLVLAPEFDVLAAVHDGPSLVTAALHLPADLIVIDITMPGLDGIAAAGLIREAKPDARIVFVTMHAETSIVERAMATGALGYVLKLTAGDDLVPALHAALCGERYVSGCVADPSRNDSV
jgi:DNA-binding NarL/FixJ family response regulator